MTDTFCEECGDLGFQKLSIEIGGQGTRLGDET